MNHLRVYENYLSARDAFREDSIRLNERVVSRSVHSMTITKKSGVVIHYKVINTEKDVNKLRGLLFNSVYYNNFTDINVIRRIAERVSPNNV